MNNMEQEQTLTPSMPKVQTKKADFRLHYFDPIKIPNRSPSDLIHFHSSSLIFYGYKIDALKTTYDSDKYNNDVFSEYVGVMIFLSGEAYIGEFS